MIEFNKNNETTIERPRAILVGLSFDANNQKKGSETIEVSMDELEALAEAAEVTSLGSMVQNLEKPNPKTYIGSGKVEELAEMVKHLEADTVIFNQELSGSQIRNLEEVVDARIIDRTILVLDIFAKRATSLEGKLQVELAQLSYRLPRLLGFGKALSRQGAGIGTRGPGEKKLETDRRHIQSRIYDIKKELAQVSKVRENQKSNRKKKEIPIVALVGYTNAGKSAVMNRFLSLLGRDDLMVESENMLFATLDTHQRRIDLDFGRSFILVDTVGFVSKLPHSLVNAFKGTLEEVKDADLILNVVDISKDEYEFQREVTEQVLSELNVTATILTVYNKIDLVNEEKPGIYGKCKDTFEISALTGEGFSEIINEINSRIFTPMLDVKLTIPYSRGDLVSYIHKNSEVTFSEHRAEGTYMEARIEERDYKKVEEFIE